MGLKKGKISTTQERLISPELSQFMKKDSRKKLYNHTPGKTLKGVLPWELLQSHFKWQNYHLAVLG